MKANQPTLTKYYDEILFEKYGDMVRPIYLKQGIEPDIVDNYISDFDTIRKRKDKELFDDIPQVSVQKNRRQDIGSYKDFHELERVVDYVKGQKQIDTEIVGRTDVEPIFENEDLKIYRADNPTEAVAIRGSWPCTWCVAAQGKNNMFNTYRYKPNEPTFYFVKMKEADITDKYHFFVIQATNYGGYIMTSAKNDGDYNLRWEEILGRQPKLNGLREIFKNIPLTPTERKLYAKFQNPISNEKFAKMPYEDKRMFLDMVGHRSMTNEKFRLLPDDLKSHYISFGLGLTDKMFQTIKDKKDIVNRYKQISKRKADEFIKTKSRNINFSISELNHLDDETHRNVVDTMKLNPYAHISNLTERFEYDLSAIPEALIHELAKYPEMSGQVVYHLMKQHPNYTIPKEILFAISNDSKASLDYATLLIQNKRDVPEIYLQSISKVNTTSYKYFLEIQHDIKKGTKTLPKEIEKTIAKDCHENISYANFMLSNKLPLSKEFLTAASEKSLCAYNLAPAFYKRIIPVPDELIQSIAQDNYLSRLLIDEWKIYLFNFPVPDILKNSANLKENIIITLFEQISMLLSKEQINNLINEFTNGVGIIDLATKYRVHSQTITNHLIANIGKENYRDIIQKSKKKISENKYKDIENEILKDFKKGMTHNKLYKKYKISPRTITNIILKKITPQEYEKLLTKQKLQRQPTVNRLDTTKITNYIQTNKEQLSNMTLNNGIKETIHHIISELNIKKMSVIYQEILRILKENIPNIRKLSKEFAYNKAKKSNYAKNFKLPTLIQKVMVLKKQGVPLKDIAEYLHIPENQIAKLYHYKN